MSPKRSKWLMFCERSQRRRERERRKTKSSDTSRQGDLHSHESLNSSPNRVWWLHGRVGVGSEIHSQRQFVLWMARNNYPLVPLSENGSKMNVSWLAIIEWVKGYSVL